MRTAYTWELFLVVLAVIAIGFDIAWDGLNLTNGVLCCFVLICLELLYLLWRSDNRTEALKRETRLLLAELAKQAARERQRNSNDSAWHAVDEDATTTEHEQLRGSTDGNRDEDSGASGQSRKRR